MLKTAPRPPLPTTVLGGFLGAGKTTVVNHLLRNAGGRRIVVLVNDFGELAIDADLIVAEDDDVLSLANGCACCSTGGDLQRALNQFLDGERRPDHLVIEASGVADPDRLADVARADPDLHLNAIVAVVDSSRIDALLADRLVGEQVANQLSAAHLLLLNKQDLAPSTGLQERLEALAPGAAVLAVSQGQAPVDLLLSDLAPQAAWRALPAAGADHEATFVRWAHRGGGPVTLERLQSALDQLSGQVLRLKGFVALSDGRVAQVQSAGGPGVIEGFSPTGETQLVAIGLRGTMDTAALDRLLGD